MHQSLELMLGLVIILLGAKLLGSIVARLGFPSILGELLMGLVVGPSLLNLVSDSAMITAHSRAGSSQPIPLAVRPALENITNLPGYAASVHLLQNPAAT